MKVQSCMNLRNIQIVQAITLAIWYFGKFKAQSSFKKVVVLDQVAYEHEGRGVQSLKIQTLSRCNKGTIVYEPAKYPNRAGINVCHLIFLQTQSSF